MKKTFIMLALAAISMTAGAQSTRIIKGAVIDKNGNPLPGATVEAKGGSEVTTVDADGTFSMEVPIWLKKARAQYAGMKPCTRNVTLQDMIFTMKPASKKHWYLLANYGCMLNSDRPGFEGIGTGHTGGLMFGFFNNWGWYFKANFGSATKGYYNYDYNYNYGYYNCYDEVVGYFSTGVSKRIYKPLHAYIGVGLGDAPMSHGRSMGTDFTVFPEIGLLYNVQKHILVNFSYSPAIGVEDEGIAHTINLGVGYVF